MLGKNEGSSHKKPPKLVPIQHPSNGKTRNFAIEMSPQSVSCSDGLGTLRSE
jgi:hypothetical protein